MELGTLVAKAQLCAILSETSCEGTEVLHSFGDSLRCAVQGSDAIQDRREQDTHPSVETNGDCAKVRLM